MEGVFKDVMVLWVLAVVLPCLPSVPASLFMFLFTVPAMLVTLADILSHVAFQAVLSMYALVCGVPGCFVADCYEAHDGHRFLPFLFVSSTCPPCSRRSMQYCLFCFYKHHGHRDGQSATLCRTQFRRGASARSRFFLHG